MAHFLAKTAVDSGIIINAVCGRFLSTDQEALLLARITSVEVSAECEPGVLTTVHKQPVHDKIFALSMLRCHGIGGSTSAQEVWRDF